MRHIRKSIICLLLAALFLLLFVCPVCAVEEPELPSVGEAYLYNVTYETVMCDKNADLPVAPASTVKLMTGLLASELLADRLNESVKVTASMLAGAPKNKIHTGDTLTVQKMLTSLLQEKNNDAAFVLAYLACGSVSTFVQKMNARADELGMTGTRYVNPTGLDEAGAATTARDVARLAEVVCDAPILKNIVRAKRYSISGGTCFPISTGMTDLGGYCQVILASMTASETLQICVVMGGKTEEDTQSSATSLLRWGANHYGLIDLVVTGQTFRQIPVTKSTDAEEVSAVAASDLTLYLPRDVTVGDDPSCDVFLDSTKLFRASLEAPVEKGQEVGFVAVYYLGERIGTVPLVAKQTVKANSLMSSIASLSDLMTSRAFITTLICAVILFGVYFLIEIRRYKERKELLRRYRSEHRHLYR